MQPEDLDIQVAIPETGEERVPFWGYVDLVLLLGLMAASFALIMFAASGWVYFHPKLKGDLMALALPVQLVVYVFVYLCFRVLFGVKYHRGVFESLGWRNTRHSLLAAGAGGVFLAFAISAIAEMIHTPKVETPFDELVKDPLSIVLLAVTAVVLAPVFEEMFFRGFLQPLLSRTLGISLGVLLTALLFGGLHSSEYKGAWQYVAGITLVGIALGVVRAKTNSIIPGAVMHGCFNAVSVVALIGAKYITHK
jgi:uncharacterized protein